MKKFKITFEIEVEHGDYLSPFGEIYIKQDIEERFDGRNIEVEEIGGEE